MPDSQVYRFFLDTPSAPFLFSIRQSPNFRPKVGDSLTDPTTFLNFRVMRDEIPPTPQNSIRITDDNIIRVTDQGDIRVTGVGNVLTPDQVTHLYFVQPANNPNRISTWTSNTFESDQTLKQLFR